MGFLWLGGDLNLASICASEQIPGHLPWPSITVVSRDHPKMLDVLLLLLGVIFFAAGLLYVSAVERI